MTKSADEAEQLCKYGVVDYAPYLGWPVKPPLHPNPLVSEIAEMLLKEIY